jgi:hypothetical protein
MKEHYRRVLSNMCEGEIWVHVPVAVEDTCLTPFFREKNLPPFEGLAAHCTYLAFKFQQLTVLNGGLIV